MTCLVSNMCHIPDNTDMTLKNVVTFNYVIFSNNYQSQHMVVSFVSGIRVTAPRIKI